MRGVKECSAAAPAFVLALFLLQRGVGTQGAMAAAGEGEVTPTPPDVPDYWPEVASDLRRVTWAHAVNSREKLDAAIAGDAMMLEADVSIASDGKTPIMAHPPSTKYDMTLKDFIDGVVKSEKKKGIKLDFKSTDAFQSAVPVLTESEARSEMLFPVWLNADVASGPGGAAVPSVSAPQFLALCKEHFPDRTLSLGWTTGLRPGQGDRYTEEHVRAMEDILNNANVTARQPITFAVRDTLAARSAVTLLPMLQARPASTLTVWGTAINAPDNEALAELVKDAGYERVYLDLPKLVPGLTPDTTTATPPTGGAGGLAGVAWTPLLAAAALATLVAGALRRF